MRRPASRIALVAMAVAWLLTMVLAITRTTYGKQVKKAAGQDVFATAIDKVTRGREVFRFDTFGDQAFWGGTLRLHEAIEGAGFGGVGPGVSPRTALAVGLKVDVDALPRNLVAHILRAPSISTIPQ